MRPAWLFTFYLALPPVLCAPAASAGDVRLQRPAHRDVIEITRLDELRFGDVTIEHHSGGSVVIEPRLGTKTVVGGVIDLGGRHGPAVFELHGEPNRRFVVRLPRRMDVGTERVGGIGALVTDFRSVPEHTGTFDEFGRAVIHVGATLRLAPNPFGGSYTTSFDIDVEYEPLPDGRDPRRSH